MKSAFASTKKWIALHKVISIVIAAAIVVAMSGAGVVIAVAMQNVPIKSITVKSNDNSIDSLSLEHGATAQLTVEIVPENASNQDIQWQSENNDIVEINSDGFLTAKAVGETNIVALNHTSHGQMHSDVSTTIPVSVVKTAEELYADELKQC